MGATVPEPEEGRDMKPHIVVRSAPPKSGVGYFAVIYHSRAERLRGPGFFATMTGSRPTQREVVSLALDWIAARRL